MLNIITNAEAKESLELVEVIELNKEELMDYITDFQCSEDFIEYVKSSLILKHICKITNIDFEKLKEKLATKMSSDDFIKAFETSIDNIFKYYWFGIKYEVADKKFNLAFSMGDFFNTVHQHYARTSIIEEDLKNNKITQNEYNAAISTRLEEDGCNYYHEEIFNEDLVYKNEELIKNFIDPDIYGQMFLYKEVKTYNRDFLTDVNTIFHLIGNHIDLTTLCTIPFEDIH